MNKSTQPAPCTHSSIFVSHWQCVKCKAIGKIDPKSNRLAPSTQPRGVQLPPKPSIRTHVVEVSPFDIRYFPVGETGVYMNALEAENESLKAQLAEVTVSQQ
jgi:hypothetical protein